MDGRVSPQYKNKNIAVKKNSIIPNLTAIFLFKVNRVPRTSYPESYRSPLTIQLT